MNTKDMEEKLRIYRLRISQLDKDHIQREIAVNLRLIFLQLKQLEDSIDSISIPEDKQ